MNQQDIMQQLSRDPAALRTVMHSQNGRTLLSLLSGGDPAALNAAARQAASGDLSSLTAMLSRVLQTPEGASLIQRLEQQLQK